MAYTTLEQFKDKLKKRGIKVACMLFIVVFCTSLLIGFFRPSGLVSILLGCLYGSIGYMYLKYDLNRFKLGLLKSEIHYRVTTNYVQSNKVGYLYYSEGLPDDAIDDVEGYANEVLNRFEGVINKSNLKILVVNKPVKDTINTLFERLNKSFDGVEDDIAGVYLHELDCIVIHYFGLSLRNCVGHEFVHFLLSKHPKNIVKDKNYKGYFDEEKSKIFSLDYQDYYRSDIDEFTAELGSYLIDGNTDVLCYSSAMMLSVYLEKFIDVNYCKKRLQ